MPKEQQDPSAPIKPQITTNTNSGWGKLVLIVCILASVAYVAAEALQTMKQKQASQQAVVASMGLVTPNPKGLASKFTDKQGTLLADPPTSSDQLVDPDTILIARLPNTDEIPGKSWADFDKHLAEVTGKKVSDVIYTGSSDQLTQFSNGKITLAAVHPADAPFIVNNYGFEPFAVLGTDSGANGNHLDIIVPAGSPIASPADLKGHSLACSAPSSITGYRAAVAVLMQDDQLRPNVDYYVLWSMGQKKSIKGIADKPAKYEAAAVSDDKLLSLLDDGDIDKSQYKVIYQSDVIPRTTIGYFYNLKPELAAKIREATLSYSSPVARDTLRFLPIDYKNDFRFLRTIDDSFDPRLDSRMMSKSHAD
jgi:phosphonate transport system substrate-binding protein